MMKKKIKKMKMKILFQNQRKNLKNNFINYNQINQQIY